MTILALWFWLGYGTQTPTRYQPFARQVERFAYPLALLTAVLLGGTLPVYARTGAAMRAVVVAAGIGIVASSGSWGQKVEISRDFLTYIKKHPKTFFVADGMTRHQLIVLNRGQNLENVGECESIPFGNADTVAVLLNPLEREKPEMNFEPGQILFATDSTYRAIAILFPKTIVRRYPWFIRRPSGKIVEVRRVIPESQVPLKSGNGHEQGVAASRGPS